MARRFTWSDTLSRYVQTETRSTRGTDVAARSAAAGAWRLPVSRYRDRHQSAPAAVPARNRRRR